MRPDRHALCIISENLVSAVRDPLWVLSRVFDALDTTGAGIATEWEPIYRLGHVESAQEIKLSSTPVTDDRAQQSIESGLLLQACFQPRVGRITLPEGSASFSPQDPAFFCSTVQGSLEKG